MPAQQSLAPAKTTLGTLPSSLPAAPAKPTAVASAAQPGSLAVVPSNAYVHVVEGGESLYTIARRYDVTAQAIVTANGSFSPDKLFVGQKLVIPGRPDLLSTRGPAAQVASIANDDVSSSPVVTAGSLPQKQTAAITDPGLLKSNVQPAPNGQSAAAQTLQTAAIQPNKPAPVLQEPAMSGADKFRWPINGKIITSFANSKGTGINIEAPEGAAIRAAENGTVIYVGSGVEGYGNLVLIRHANGYVSAYAHLKAMSVAKGDVVNRGDTIGAAGMTGSVTRPQLHFELRKGATPVDPVPMLAS